MFKSRDELPPDEQFTEERFRERLEYMSGLKDIGIIDDFGDLLVVIDFTHHVV
jgi:hypothetical protein